MAIIFLAPKISYICADTKLPTCPCSNPVYDRSIFKNTMIMEWNLICDKKFHHSWTQTMFQFGTLVGSIIFGMASDRFGRKKPLSVAVVIQVLCGYIAAFINDFYLFTFFRFLIGTSVGGTMVITFVIVMEFVGVQYRDVISALYQVPFALGYLLLPGIAYFTRDYIHFQLAIAVPTTILLCYICLAPETPRWLIAMKKTDKAIKLLEHVAKINHRQTERIRADVDAYQAEVEKHNLKKGTLIDLFRTPNLRKNILTMSLDWFSCSYCFYGVSQYVGQLSGDVFLNVACSAFVALLGTLASIPMLKLFGRRTIVIIFNFVCAVCLFILAMIPEGVGSLVCASVGVVSGLIVFVVVYLYCTELFPTVVRNAALGFSSMMARVGAMIAPFVVELQDIASWVPPIVFGVVPLVAGCVTFLLPETKGCQLSTTLEEGEAFGKKITQQPAPDI
ncbi:organic cation transporter protein-like [Pectinophora gossypiella]|uniref:organic cation transporter protein-like n=1 Tax=Pectinophora gossypiella TaxID=13191 RepID=UPI00214F4BD5|nr:organic cation transporter protein-like [Pectinophora gossypiella]